MAEILRMPEVAANAAEAVLQGWLVPVGGSFTTGLPIATVETEKAVVDVEAERDGVVLATLVPEGATVRAGQPIAVLGDPAELTGDLDAILADLDVADAQASAGPTAEPTARPATATEPASAPLPGRAPAKRVFASPLARRLAKEAGIPLGEIQGTGPNGRVVRRDVEAARAAAAPVEAPAEAPPPAPPREEAAPAARAHDGPVPSGTGYTDVPHSRFRRVIAARLTESAQTIPCFSIRGTARVGELLDLRKRLNAGGDAQISVNDLVVKAAAAAHARVPAMNVIWTPDAIRSFTSVDVGVAVASRHGVVAPVVRSAERITVSAISATVRDFGARAEAGRLRPEELQGGTLTVTNLGMHGTEEFSAIINQPQSAILAVGAAHEEPVADNGEIVAATVMRVTLSVDHRPIDGVVAAEWMRVFLALLRSPLGILA